MRLIFYRKLIWLTTVLLAVFILFVSLHFIFEDRIQANVNGECPLCSLITALGNSAAGIQAVLLLFLALVFFSVGIKSESVRLAASPFVFSSQAPPLS